MRISQRDRERFWKKVRVDHGTGCWIWTASVRTWNREPWNGGYPAFKLNSRVVRGHIFAYQLLFGPIPHGKVLLYSCDNRRCVNVLEHIRPGTQVENVRDMLLKGRSNHQKNGGIP